MIDLLQREPSWIGQNSKSIDDAIAQNWATTPFLQMMKYHFPNCSVTSSIILFESQNYRFLIVASLWLKISTYIRKYCELWPNGNMKKTLCGIDDPRTPFLPSNDETWFFKSSKFFIWKIKIANFIFIIQFVDFQKHWRTVFK